MPAIQPELGLDVEDKTEPATRALTRPIQISAESFMLALNLDDLEQAVTLRFGRTAPTALQAVLRKLRHCARYKVRKTVARGTRKADATLQLDRVEERYDGEKLRRVLLLPKGRSQTINDVLAEYGLHCQRIHAAPGPADLTTLPLPFADGRTLSPEQCTVLRAHLSTGHSTLLDVAMAGGKSLLIAGLLRARKDLRPAVVTGSLATDSAQLALSLARLTGEKVCLVGCAGAVDAQAKRANLERNWNDAAIIVGTHALVRRVPAVALNQPEIGDASTFETPDLFSQSADGTGIDEVESTMTSDPLGERLRSAPLFVADEVDALATVASMSHLLSMRPVVFHGASGTWGRRSDHVDRVFEDLLCSAEQVLCPQRVTHDDLAAQGRVSPVELISYDFDETAYRKHRASEPKAFTLVQEAIVQRGDRNRFIADCLRHLLTARREEHRGAIMVFVKTVEHAFRLLWQIAAVEDLDPVLLEMKRHGIIVHHAQLPASEKRDHLDGIRDRRYWLVITTDALAIGLDAAEISDLVDATGMQEVWKTLQRSGRSIRPSAAKVSARIHVIRDYHHPALIGIGRRKCDALEQYFGRNMISYTATALPWLRPVKIAREAERLDAELTRAGF